MQIRLAFVVPRYGEQVLGGAEAITRQVAEHLPPERFVVDVLTTCAIDIRSWENVLPSGISQLNGITVRRFPIDHNFRVAKIYDGHMIRFSNHWPHTVDDEYEWLDHSAHSPELYHYLVQHHDQYDLIFFGPYLFGMTYYGMTIAPEKSVLWPFVHDEAYARFLPTRLMMLDAKAMVFNCEPELDLAKGKLAIHNPNMVVTGLGVKDVSGDAARFRQQTGITNPFVVYAGRFETMKNVPELLTFFRQYKLHHPSDLKILLIGKGPVTIPNHPDVLSLGYVDEQLKCDALAAADVLIQPSVMESFSLVIMEAWLTQTPVLVHGDCDVTRYHVLQSNGGLYYSGYDEFSATLDWLLSHNDQREVMGMLGRQYVLKEYNWPKVIDRLTSAIDSWLA